MLAIYGYKLIEKIHEGLNTVVYRGQREQDKKAVILKILKSDYPTSKEIAQVRHEYEIAKNIDSQLIVKYLGIEKVANSLALILEDFGGTSLKNAINSSQFNLFQFLELAIQLAECINQLHNFNIVHKDIKPQNIIFNPKTGQVKIADFSLASLLPKENQTISNPNCFEGTLAYMSPEQTGRMNRAIDYRTDFYSLGITFYEMLSGQLPYQTTDPMELVHCHLAKKPLPLHKQNPGIPKAVSNIVMKLLAKTAEERYQSAYGLKADLAACLTQLQATGKIDNLIPGQHDVPTKFQIPQKLYDREQEIANLMAAFERISQGGLALRPTSEMVLISGYSGIGKSALVNEIHKPIVQKKGYFVAGKFEQLKRNIPYAALIQSFQELIRQLLTESEDHLLIWKAKLLDAFGANGQLIIDVIPEVELIVGQQSPVPQMESDESKNRFHQVFKQFVRVFTKKEHPLVVFLDDLQWADSASLKLIQLLITDPDSQYLLLIGAYRDNEVGPTHPLMLTLNEIEKMGAQLNHIALRPLDTAQVNQLIADALNCEQEKAKPLAELVVKKTQGNPFFLTQLLTSLYQNKLLSYDPITSCWQWDIELLQTMKITDNVVELMVSKIQNLSENTQNILKIAACIGNIFNLDILALANQKSLSATAEQLWEALQEGLILPLSNDYKIPLAFDQSSLVNCQEKITDNRQLTIIYKFLHDRVQQAAYFLIPEFQKKETHLNIGQLLLKHTPPSEIEENIFEIVNQLNFGTELITSQVEKDELAKLNLIAGQKAKASMAYEAAVGYLNAALELLAEKSWRRQYDLTLALYIETAITEYLRTNYERAEKLTDVLLNHVKNLLEKIKVYELKIQFYSSQNKMQEAINTAKQVLKMLEVTLPEDTSNLKLLGGQIQRKMKILGIKGIEDLSELPEMTDPYKLAAMRILMKVMAPAYVAEPTLYPLVILTMVNLCIKYGNSSLAAYAYISYSILLCAVLEDIDSGYQFGQLALRVLRKFDTQELKCKINLLFNAFVRLWKEHARETIEPLHEAIQSGVETGDIEYAAYAVLHSCVYPFFTGEPLETIEKKQAQYLELMLKLKQEYQIYSLSMWRQVVLNLVGGEKKYCLTSESFNEAEMLLNFINFNNYSLLFSFYLAKSILFYLFKDYAQSAEAASSAEKYEAAGAGLLYSAEHNLYYSLALLAHYPSASTIEQKQYLKIVVANQKRIKKWAYYAPANYQHKYDIVEAEKARVLGKDSRAMEYYDRAIAGAKSQGYIIEVALSHELAAEFYLSRGREKIAQTYLTESCYSYTRWGATAKVKDLESRYPQLLSQKSTETTIGKMTNSTTSSSSSTNGEALDLTTIMKASLALSGEIALGKLLNKLLKIMMENAGAQTSCLILEKNGQLLVEATGTVEQSQVVLWSSTPVRVSQLPISLINYVARTQEHVVLNNATQDGRFNQDYYIVENQPKSILCAPIINQGKLIGLLYLENNLTTGAFTTDRLQILRILSSKAAISLENALLYANLEETTEKLKSSNEKLEDYSRTLEQKVEERTEELKEKNEFLKEQATQLEQALHNLKQTQTQLIQTEKMSALGQMVAGVAHEINNPVNFIYGNLTHAREYLQDLLHLIHLYQQQPNPTPDVRVYKETIELEFLLEDFPKLLDSMHVGADRIHQIVLSLRNFSRLDEADMKPVDIHQGIENTLLIVQHRLNEKTGHRGIQVIKEYGDLPQVECYAGQLNQVFMNILTNAIDALEEYDRRRQDAEIQSNPSTIRIWTGVVDRDQVTIRISDNGPGMTEEVGSKLFDPFFTTKPVGSGTGLGLSISYHIVVEKHGGQLKCISAPGQGAEFVIEIPVKPRVSSVTE